MKQPQAQQLLEANLEEIAQIGFFLKAMARAELPGKTEALGIDSKEVEEETEQELVGGFLEFKEIKLLVFVKAKGEKEGLPPVYRMKLEGFLRNSFCITSKHFKDPCD